VADYLDLGNWPTLGNRSEPFLSTHSTGLSGRVGKRRLPLSAANHRPQSPYSQPQDPLSRTTCNPALRLCKAVRQLCPQGVKVNWAPKQTKEGIPRISVGRTRHPRCPFKAPTRIKGMYVGGVSFSLYYSPLFFFVKLCGHI
jgi:hypothetical protein